MKRKNEEVTVPQKPKKKKPEGEKRIAKNYHFKTKVPDVSGTMKKGYISPDRQHIFLTFKQPGHNQELLYEFSLLKKIKSLGLPTISHLQIALNQQDGNLVLQQDFIPDGVLIKPHNKQDRTKLVRLASNNPLFVAAQISHMHHILDREYILIEDFQFLVSKDTLEIKIIDPFNIIRLYPATHEWEDGHNRYARRYQKKWTDFQEQQTALQTLLLQLTSVEPKTKKT